MVRVYRSFTSLPESYDALFASAGRSSVFLSRPWFDNFVRTIGGEETLRLFGHENPEPRALLPLTEKRYRLHAYPIRRLESLSNCYTSLFSSIHAGAMSDTYLPDIVAAISSERPSCDCLHMRPFAQDDPLYEAFLRELLKRGFAVHAYPCFGNWYHPVEGQLFSDYYLTLPSKLKNTLRRKSAKFAAAGGRIKILTGVDEVEEGIAWYEEVYKESWKEPESYPAFIPGFIRVCAAEGWLKLGISLLGDEPIAAQLWILCDGRAQVFKLAYKRKYAKFSAGTILTANLLQQAMDTDRVREIDYLSGDDSYKKEWVTHRRERYGIYAFNKKSLGGNLLNARYLGGRLWRSLFPVMRSKCV